MDGLGTAAAAGTFRLGGVVEVARLGFGGIRITGPGIVGEPRDPAEARRVLLRAVELGVTFVDTAHSSAGNTASHKLSPTDRSRSIRRPRSRWFPASSGPQPDGDGPDYFRGK